MDAELHRTSITYQEIIRQQNGWKLALESIDEDQTTYKNILKKYRDYVWVFSGCGTSFYLAQTASHVFGLLTGFRTKCTPASEILMFPDLVYHKGAKHLLVPISRSGTTTEIVMAAQKSREKYNIPTLAISCDANSTLSLESNLRIAFHFDQEKSVVMTGSFTTMLLSLAYIASLQNGNSSLSEKFHRIADSSKEEMIECEPIVKKISSNDSLNDFVFLGQGPFYGIANEAALKMQEMTISISQSFHSLEYRHGPMSTTSENTLIILLSSQITENYETQLIEDLKNLGARILIFSSEDSQFCLKSADYQIEVPAGYGNILNPLLYMPILQLLAYYKALAKNINPDNPKNLTAVVKLEM